MIRKGICVKMPHFKLDSIERYGTKQNLSVALLGFSSGIPILMTLSTLTYWLSTLGVNKGAIGLASLLGMPYLLKFLWAPFLDLFQLPILGKLGRRKGFSRYYCTDIYRVISDQSQRISHPSRRVNFFARFCVRKPRCSGGCLSY